ncbi:hypothetical protein RclHR1_21510002 [Rhizophagus clarus]|uniref:Uncharacterized protein n=1 Tax=Rhizophagus clarus TaxID=94130 RepID=A0A2Z6R672_9GLOM|nr:hypothetical protein RclHR1_21510002 [Rhizophagus clarus]
MGLGTIMQMIGNNDANVEIGNDYANIKIRNDDANVRIGNDDTNIEIRNDDKNVRIGNDDANIRIRNNDTNVKIGNDDKDVNDDGNGNLIFIEIYYDEEQRNPKRLGLNLKICIFSLWYY